MPFHRLDVGFFKDIWSFLTPPLAFDRNMSKSGMVLPLLAACFFLSACSTTYKGSPDFSVAETRLDLAYRTADPATRKHLDEAKKQLASAKQLCLANTEQLEQAVKERNEALAKTEYWKAKQRKSLEELWFWRGALIISVLFAARGPILWLARKFIGIPW